MTKINWKELYQDLPTHVAKALRDARMKPEQIVVKEDGELMAIEGITEKDVESIRLLYNTDISVIADVGVERAQPAEPVDSTPTPARTPLPPRKRGKKYKAMAKTTKKGA